MSLTVQNYLDFNLKRFARKLKPYLDQLGTTSGGGSGGFPSSISGNTNIDIGNFAITYKNSTYSSNGIFNIDGNSGTVYLGDVDSAVNNTWLNLNDSTKSIQLHTNVDGSISIAVGNGSGITLSGTQVSMGTGDGTNSAGVTFASDFGGGNVQFDLQSGDGVNTVEILGNGLTNSIIHTAGSHKFNGNVGIGVEPAYLFHIKDGINEYMVIDTTLNAETSAMHAQNNGGQNETSFVGSVSDTSATFSVVSGFNTLAKFVQITGTVSASTRTIDYKADKHTFTGILNLPTITNSSPTDGDVWRADNTNTGLKVRINGVTKTITVS